MSTTFVAAALEVQNLQAAMHDLEAAGGTLQLAPLAGREWYELLTRKLVPQLADDPYLVAAVVGGTNIGKSVIFNHLAGFRASATSPLASGTKHPVCLVPRGFTQRHDLQRIFPGFELHAWQQSEEALQNYPEDRIFWRESDELPSNLLILDTPDIDSDAEINWERADRIRHCADVLVAVITQQKYNDAAVKQFFRKAVAEDKATLVVFNQCLLPADEEYWPLWLDTFCRETRMRPDFVYLAPNDRAAAEQLRLPFHPRDWPLPGPSATRSAQGEQPAAAIDRSGPQADARAPRDLRADLSTLHFTEIKLRTLQGALHQVVSPSQGAPTYLAEVRARSDSFQSAARHLAFQELARIENWPALPSKVMVGAVREWWRTQRAGKTRTIHEAYAVVGSWLAHPVQWAREQWGRPPTPLMETYRAQEWDVISAAVMQLQRELGRLQNLGHDLLRSRIESLVREPSYLALFETLKAEHSSLDLDEDLRRIVWDQMDRFRVESPTAFESLRRLDQVGAAVRPLASIVSLAGGGLGAEHLVAHAAGPVLVHLICDVAGGMVTVAAAEPMVVGAGGMVRWLEAKFQQLQVAFAASRAQWFARFLQERLLGRLHEDLTHAAAIPESSAYRKAEASLESLRRLRESGQSAVGSGQ